MIPCVFEENQPENPEIDPVKLDFFISSHATQNQIITLQFTLQ